jgi:hypothetical protein
MKLPITLDGLSPDRAASTARPVARMKRSLATTLCAGASASWALSPRAAAPYRYGDGCYCLSPEQHGAQFRQDGWELGTLKGHC